MATQLAVFSSIILSCGVTLGEYRYPCSSREALATWLGRGSKWSESPQKQVGMVLYLSPRTPQRHSPHRNN